jgi:hypothetical protein
VQLHDLQVILRLGYTHDNGPYNEPEGFLRQIVVGADAVTFKAWCDYLDRLWVIAQHYPNVLGGLITWEDFFLMDLIHFPSKQRLILANRTGYKDYLEKHYSLEEISTRYKHSFSDYAEVPIPAFKSSAIHLFCEFWDKLLIETIFKESKKHFPPLTMEVRLDCDLQEDSHICHHSTFDLTSEAYLTTIYYTPAWGASNDGGLESASSILERMQFMFEHLRGKTNNAFFIDQFNFIDNTPGFEHSTGILPEEIPHFLSGVADILQQQTVGYGMWTLRDVRANALKNGLFEQSYPCWEIANGEIIVDTKAQKKAVLINQGGTLSQLLSHCVGIPLVEGMPFQLEFQAKKAKNVDEAVHLLVSVVYENNILYENTVLEELCENWQNIHLEEIPFYLGYELRIENRGASVLLSDFYLYQQCQENGIIDVVGNPKSFYNDLVLLNQKLNQPKDISPKSFFQQNDITPQVFNGVFPDLWMGKILTGIIAKPTECETFSFVIKAYVPETWHNYQNQLILTLADTKYPISQPINKGCVDILIPLGNCSFSNRLFFRLEAKNVCSPKDYDEHSQDNREVSMQLIELGFFAEAGLQTAK